MTERETLLAEIAALWTVRKIAPDNEFIEATLEQRQARLAEIDAEPDYEAWRPALEAFCIGQGDDAPNITLDKWDKATIRGLIAAFAKAPPMGERQPRWPSYLQVEALARRVEGGVTNGVRLVAYDAAMEMAKLLYEQMTGQQP
jgi:hypothetical protein